MMKPEDSELIARAARVRLLLMDCDGVLTDGRLYFGADGEVMKVFNVRDGQGIAAWHAAGYSSGIISGRDARSMVARRAEELGVSYVFTGSKDKSADLDEILASAGVGPEETAFIGDDVGDLPVLCRVGFPVAVADAVPEVIGASVFRTTLPGGRGAVRELVDLLLHAKRGSVSG